MLFIWWLCPFAILASAMPAGDSSSLERRDSPAKAYDGNDYDVDPYHGNSNSDVDSYDGSSYSDDADSYDGSSYDGSSYDGSSYDGSSNSDHENLYNTEDNGKLQASCPGN